MGMVNLSTLHELEREPVADMVTSLRSQLLEFKLTGGAAARPQAPASSARCMDVSEARARVDALLGGKPCKHWKER